MPLAAAVGELPNMTVPVVAPAVTTAKGNALGNVDSVNVTVQVDGVVPLTAATEVGAVFGATLYIYAGVVVPLIIIVNEYCVPGTRLETVIGLLLVVTIVEAMAVPPSGHEAEYVTVVYGWDHIDNNENPLENPIVAEVADTLDTLAIDNGAPFILRTVCISLIYIFSPVLSTVTPYIPVNIAVVPA